MHHRIIPIRASSVAELFDCPARWEAKNLLGMRMPSSGAARLGTAIHAGTAAYDQAKLDGSPINPDDAADELVKTLHDTDEEVDWDEARPQDAERIGLALLTRYCAEIAPHQDYVAVELTCERMEVSDLGIALTGTTDRVRRTAAGELGIADLKSGARAVGADGTVNTVGHGAQMGVYEILAQHALGQPITAPAQIVGLQTGKTAAAQRVGTGEILDARAALVGADDSPGLLQHASRLLHNGTFYGNPKSVLCSAKYCPRHPTCKFKG
ncbi:RecB family exonuclease [Bordetella bronchiseptica]